MDLATRSKALTKEAAYLITFTTKSDRFKKAAGNTEIWTYAYDPFGRRLSKERKDKLAWTSTDPKRTHFVWDGTRLLQE